MTDTTTTLPAVQVPQTEEERTNAILAKHPRLHKEMIPTMWKPGQTGNPKGKPKAGKYIADILRRHGALPTPRTLLHKIHVLFPQLRAAKLTLEEAMWLHAYIFAIKGEGWAFQLIADRLEGKVNSNGIPGEDREIKVTIRVDNSDRNLEV